jgi:cytochrome P450
LQNIGEALKVLGKNEKNINTACEEFVRYVSPLTAIARTCPHGAEVGEQEISAGTRVGLCWPSANRDESVFEKADEVVLDRVPNPHIGFGFGIHNCLGAPQGPSDYPKLIESSFRESEFNRVDFFGAQD